jgi:succinyl-diaminopimelate desuccinylase
MNTIDLTKKLISIPSYVQKNVNEGKLGEFIYQYLKKFSWLSVEKQYVTPGRFNVIAKDQYPTKALVCDHIDTVQIQSGWKTDPFKSLVRKGKLYGLGASDSKSGVASLLSAIENTGPTKGLMVLFYIDEEYDFVGMRKFIEKYKGKIDPKIIGSADGGNLELGNTCRGLIEITFQVNGKAGHAAVPESGNNAILGSYNAISKFKDQISKYKTKELGKSTINLAWISGGQKVTGSNELGKEGNVIPDFCQFVLEVRTANPELNAEKVIKLISYELTKQNLSLITATVSHDYGAWITPKADLKVIAKIAKTNKFTEAEKRGYVDLQMLWQNFGKPVCFSFGVGESSACHKANEYVEIYKLKKGEMFWTNLLKSVCGI